MRFFGANHSRDLPNIAIFFDNLNSPSNTDLTLTFLSKGLLLHMNMIPIA